MPTAAHLKSGRPRSRFTEQNGSPRDFLKQPFKRCWPIGAEVQPEGGVHFRVWAPVTRDAAVLIESADARPESAQIKALQSEPGGYWSGSISSAGAGTRYRFQIDGEFFPDPASRFQPDGVSGPSQVVDPSQWQWTDRRWRGLTRENQVIYEIHIGTFTHAGTWNAALRELPALAELGISMLEVMPVAEFPGRFGWGYDGVNLFAPTRLYGSPDDFRAFVNAAHALQMGVILDVVYNHLGPEGNCLRKFAPDYFSRLHSSEWGESLNFDGPNCDPVREFVQTNAAYWIREFHLDGLRIDATQQIFDHSRPHIIAEIARSARAAGAKRRIYLVGENEPQICALVRDPNVNGFGLDALWNDDVHHSAHVCLTGQREGYYNDYQGTPQEFISAAKWGYLFQGQFYRWQKKRRGTHGLDLEPSQFVAFLENHDQLANSLSGKRIHQLADPAKHRALTAYLLLGPATPLLFQGQEFGASAPFLYFADYGGSLAEQIAEGRRRFLCQFPSIAQGEIQALLRSPEAEATFLCCKLNSAERESHGPLYRLHRDLLKFRRRDAVLQTPRRGGLDGAVLGHRAFVLRFFSRDGLDRLLLINLGADFCLSPVPEPLLAPCQGRHWVTAWNSEHPLYGGRGALLQESYAGWQIPGPCAVFLVPSAEGNCASATERPEGPRETERSPEEGAI
jgi:maltooligosyltrehalose trehalohydrolase